MTLPTIRSLSCLLALTGASAAFGGEDLLWDTPYPSASVYGTSQSVKYGGTSPRDREVADDFNVTGQIERLVVTGRGCGNCSTPVVDGVFVRFYEWTSTGPGGLEQEFFVPTNQGFTFAGSYPYTLNIQLPQPFQASGWHFISVQVKYGDSTGGTWNFVQSNRFNFINSPIQFRDNRIDGVWRQDSFFSEPQPADFVISMYGEAGAVQPTVAGVSRSTVTGSDRIIITGDGFGAPGDGTFNVNGVEGLVKHWSSTQIIGYVPEGVSPGPASLTVTNLGVVSDPLPITIVPREPNGRVRWVFEGDGDYVSFPPTIGPNGNIYFSDIDGDLYAMSADGALLWIVDALLGQQGSADEAPVQVGADGTIYCATNPLGPTVELVAFHPDGSRKWTFTVPHALTWQAGPSIGPDGRLYGALNAAVNLGLDYDVLQINADGTPGWTRAANPTVIENAARGQSVLFVPSSPGGQPDRMVFTADRNGDGRNFGFDIDNGAQAFATPTAGGNDVGQGQLAAARDGSGEFYMFEFTGVGGLGWGLQAFDGDGDRTWRYDPDIASGATRPVVDVDGTIYFGYDLGRLTAVTPEPDEVWTKFQQVIYREPAPNPAGPSVLAVGTFSFNQPSFAEGRRKSDGELLWTQTLVDDAGANVTVYTGPAFGADDTAFFSTLEMTLTPNSVFRIFAVDASEGDFCPGDVDGDGVIGFNDLNLLLGDYGQSGAGLPGDIDGDGDVDFSDLNALLGVYGQNC